MPPPTAPYSHYFVVNLLFLRILTSIVVKLFVYAEDECIFGQEMAKYCYKMDCFLKLVQSGVALCYIIIPNFLQHIHLGMLLPNMWKQI
jgi:hypothetical protein